MRDAELSDFVALRHPASPRDERRRLVARLSDALSRGRLEPEDLLLDRDALGRPRAALIISRPTPRAGVLSELSFAEGLEPEQRLAERRDRSHRAYLSTVQLDLDPGGAWDEQPPLLLCLAVVALLQRAHDARRSVRAQRRVPIRAHARSTLLRS